MSLGKKIKVMGLNIFFPTSNNLHTGDTMVWVLSHIKNGPSGHLFSACLLMEINVIYAHCTS